MLDTRHGNFLLRWDSSSSLSNGFTKLQQMQEFVDVTLAAGGHLVGAHQNILALASPYLKEMLKSAPCPHPVIFLGSINHTVLAFLLEYIYTGEVKVPRNIFPSFVEASKLLHIAGLKDIQVPQQYMDSIECITPCDVSSPQNIESSRFPNNPTQNRTDEENEEDVRSAEELLLPQDITDLRSRVSDEFTIQNTKSFSPVQLITIDNEKLINVQTLPIAMEELQQPQENYLPNEISDQPLDAGTTHFAACITIDNESHEVNVEPLNYGNDNLGYAAVNGLNDIPIYENSIIPESGNKAVNEDCGMITESTDLEDLIPSKTVSMGSKACTTTLHEGIHMDESENYLMNFIDTMSEKNTFKVDLPTASGLLTISTKLNDTESTDKNKEDDNCIEVSGTIATALYIKSIRGNVIMILNRFMYNLHHTAFKGSKRRWRCIDYRRKNCRAYIDTVHEDIVCRKEMHTHLHHDNKVVKLGRRQEFKTTIEEALKTTNG